MMKYKVFLILITIFTSYIEMHAHQGMWLPQLLAGENEAKMQAMGMKITAEDIYSVNGSSLKDAIVHFGGFCTGEIVSDQGLIITNHHCGYRAIQDHSSIENNLLKEGFWAMSKEEELSNPDLFVKFIRRIEDVSDQVLMGIDITTPESERLSIINANIDTLRKSIMLGKYEEIEIKPFYDGNKYYMIISESYNDVRLVGAPPSSIGKFGADTDNWEWPRHTGDFAVFRVYTAPDGSPAEYNVSNIPMIPKHHLPVSLDGVDDGDFTMIFGFPGTTNEYLPSYAIDQLVNDINPKRIALREVALEVMDRKMRKDEAINIAYASKFASIANYWKKWKGENIGLKKTNAIQKKKKIEAELEAKVEKDARFFAYYGDLIPEFERIYTGQKDMVVTQNLLSELIGRIVDLYRNASTVKRAQNVYENSGPEEYKKYLEGVRNTLKSRFENYDYNMDKELAQAASIYYKNNVNQSFVPSSWQVSDEDLSTIIEDIYEKSNLSTWEKVDKLMKLEADSLYNVINRDPAIGVFDDLITSFQLFSYPDLNNYEQELQVLQRKFMQAQMALYPDQAFYPDANSTMRVTYGNVKGYEPRDAVIYKHYTTLKGVIAKYVPGDYEFDLPQKLIDLYEARDYGDYSNKKGELPVCFLATNHTTGGNSGSPVINAHGHFIGVNFDRVWEGTMSDYYYDPSICRNIMVDARYILFIIDKYAGATHLIEEMDLVRQETLKN